MSSTRVIGGLVTAAAITLVVAGAMTTTGKFPGSAPATGQRSDVLAAPTKTASRKCDVRRPHKIVLEAAVSLAERPVPAASQNSDKEAKVPSHTDAVGWHADASNVRLITLRKNSTVSYRKVPNAPSFGWEEAAWHSVPFIAYDCDVVKVGISSSHRAVRCQISEGGEARVSKAAQDNVGCTWAVGAPSSH